jgi:hypothetical protein
MTDKEDRIARLKKMVMHEAFEFYAYTLFLFILFSIFTVYQRLLLDEYGHQQIYYGYSLIQALILAKVILIGEGLHVGKRFQNKPLLIPVFYKTIIFSLAVLVMLIIEHFVTGYFKGHTVAETCEVILKYKANIMLSKIFILFIIFFQFFSFLELNKALGEGKLFDLFFKRRKQ